LIDEVSKIEGFLSEDENPEYCIFKKNDFFMKEFLNHSQGEQIRLKSGSSIFTCEILKIVNK